MTPETVAQTNIQLYNQLRALRSPLADLEAVHRAYELTVKLYGGYMQADGKPFASHCVGVASILAITGCPVEVVTAALIHNVYTNGDFGDGREYHAGRARRHLVRSIVGSEIEAMVHRFFRDYRARSISLVNLEARAEAIDATDRPLLLIELADRLEKYVDAGAFYYADPGWLDDIDEEAAVIVAVAQRLGEQKLAGLISTTYAAAIAEGPSIAASLRPADGRRYLKLILPPSSRIRYRVRLKARIWRGLHRLVGWLRPASRLRRVLQSALRAVTPRRAK